jgi:hypothetical protein
MILRLNSKNKIDVYNFVISSPDRFEDFYVTFNKERKFLKDLKLIEKLLKYQEVYALYREELEGLLIIFREKGFRPYLKILSKNSKTDWDLLRFFSWNCFDEIYAKLKLDNPLTRTLQKQNKITKRLIFGFISKGNRGKEILLYRPRQEKRQIIIGEKDNDHDSRKIA